MDPGITPTPHPPQIQNDFNLFSLFSLKIQEDDALFAPVELLWGGSVRGKVEEGGGHGSGGGGKRDGGPTHLTDVGGPPARPNSLRARAFVDCGASHGLVSHAFVVTHGIHMEANTSQGACLLGDGSASVQHLGRTEPIEVRCGTQTFVYAFHILQTAAYDVIFGRDVMRLCGMHITNVPAVYPTNLLADGPRRAEEQALRERRRLTGQEQAPYESLPAYKVALKMCQEAVERNVSARAASGGKATSLPHSQLRVRHPSDTPPSYVPPYPIKPTDRDFVVNELNEWLLWCQIERVPQHSHSPYNTPLLVAYTYGSDGSIKKRRLCGDFRGLNKKLIIEEFGLPLIKDLLMSVSSESLFSEIDLRQAYLQFDVHPDDRVKLRFRFDGKTYQWVRGSFGIASLSDHCQRHISLLFSDIPAVRVYMDNILLATGRGQSPDSDSILAHAATVVQMLDRMTEYFLWVRPEKCHFLRPSIRTLGHLVGAEGVSLDPDKVAQVQAWPVPTTYSQLRAFLGFVAFLRGHVRHAADLAAPLHKIRDPGKGKKASNSPITLDPTQVAAFDALKAAVATSPTLRRPDFTRPFVVATDASTVGVGGVLFQPAVPGEAPSADNIVAFVSRSLHAHEYAYSAYKLECLALVYCLREWDDVLHGTKFTVETDHRALIFLLDNTNRILANWLQIILDYRFDIIHVPGSLNVAPDMLSRIYAGHVWGSGRESHFSTATTSHTTALQTGVQGGSPCSAQTAVSHSRPSCLQSRSVTALHRIGSQTDVSLSLSHPSCLPAVRAEPRPPTTVVRFSPEAPSVRVIPNGREPLQPPHPSHNTVSPPLEFFSLAAPSVTSQQRDLILLAHEQGHFGVMATYERMRTEGHNWPGMRLHVIDAVAACPVCRAWTANKARFGPLNSLLTRVPMEHVQFDLVSSFVPSGEFTYLLVLVDLFTGYTWLIPIPNKETRTIASALWGVFSHFGWPKVVQSDGDATNITAVIRTMIADHGAEHRSISAYNPRAIGKVEARGGTAALCIRKLLATTGGNDWPAVASIAQSFMNSKHDAVTQTSPFFLMFNRQPVTFADYVLSDNSAEPTPAEREAWEKRLSYARELAHPSVAQQIETSKLQVAEHVNASRPQADQLPAGQKVMLRRSALVRGKNISPFEPTPYTAHPTPERHRYELRNAVTGKVRSTSVPVEHLKVLPEPVFKPALTEDDRMRLWPVEAILDHRKRKVEGVTRNEYLIRWTGFGAESDSWEPVTAIADGSLITQYHAAQANSRLRTRQAQGIRR